MAKLHQIKNTFVYLAIISFLCPKIYKIKCINPTFQRRISSNTFSGGSFDICVTHNNNFFFYLDCVNNIQKAKSPWFGYINDVNIYLYRSYFKVLKDLILIEEVIIARAHLIITIIKLRQSSESIFASYSQICIHAIVFSQQPDLLFNLISSNKIRLYDVITIVKLVSRPHNDDHLRYSDRVR